MKIAIYGDSYACMCPTDTKLNDQLPWFKLLNDHADITNYSVGGSSLHYSYKMFLEHKNKYDKNIVLGSFIGRYYAPHLTWPHVSISIVNFPNTWKNHGLSQEEIDAFIMYYKYVYNEPTEQVNRTLIENEIMSTPNTLYISIADTLGIVTCREREHFRYNSVKDTENMSAHMTNNSNKVFFNTVLNWINNKDFKFNLDDYTLPDKQDRYKYYI